MALVRPCTTSAGFMVTGERKLNLANLRPVLAEKGYEILVDARVLLLVRRGTEASIYDHGKVILKTADRDEAQAAYDALEPLLAAHPRP